MEENIFDTHIPEGVMPEAKRSTVVVWVIGGLLIVMAAMVFAYMQGVKNKVKNIANNNTDMARSANLKTIKTALEIYQSHKGLYPSTLKSLVPEYLDANLADLNNSQVYTYTPDDTDKNYKLCVKQENGKSICVGNKQ
jgi:hypothetical protein